MSNLIRGLRGLALTGLAGSFAAHAATPDTVENAYWNLPKGVTDISHEVFNLHMAAFWVCVAIAVVVFGVMFYSVFAHRRSKNPVPAGQATGSVMPIAFDSGSQNTLKP